MELGLKTVISDSTRNIEGISKRITICIADDEKSLISGHNAVSPCSNSNERERAKALRSLLHLCSKFKATKNERKFSLI